MQAIIDEFTSYIEDLEPGLPNSPPDHKKAPKPMRRTQTAAEGAHFAGIDTAWTGYKKSAKTARLYNSTRRHVISDAQLQYAKDQIAHLQRVLDGYNTLHPNLKDVPMPWNIPCDIGWAWDVLLRIYQHGRYMSSIPLMNVTSSISRRVTNGEVHVQCIHIYKTVERELVKTTEHILSRLCCAYRTWGGWNVIVGGISTTTDAKIPASSYDEATAECGRAGVIFPNAARLEAIVKSRNQLLLNAREARKEAPKIKQKADDLKTLKEDIEPARAAVRQSDNEMSTLWAQHTVRMDEQAKARERLLASHEKSLKLRAAVEKLAISGAARLAYIRGPDMVPDSRPPTPSSHHSSGGGATALTLRPASQD